MFVFWFKVFIVFSVVFVATQAHAEEKAEKNSHDRFFAAWKRAAKAANLKGVEAEALPVQANLRTVNEESRFLQGYGFLAEYSSPNCEEASFKSLRIIKLNDCVAENDRVRSRKYRGWVTVRGNLALTTNEWSDDDVCKNGWSKSDDYYPDNTCFDGFKAWHGPMPENPPAFLANSVGFFQFGDNRKCLDSDDPIKDFYYAEFNRIGTCIEYDPEDPYRDTIITGCSDNAGVQMQRYYSEDGSCTDGSSFRLYNPRDTCVWYDIYFDNNFGWTKFECY